MRNMDIKQISKDYESGLKLRELVDKYGTSITTIWMKLKEAGVKMRQKGYRLTSEQEADIFRLRVEGATLQAIGNKYGITREAIRQVIIRRSKDEKNK